MPLFSAGISSRKTETGGREITFAKSKDNKLPLSGSESTPELECSYKAKNAILIALEKTCIVSVGLFVCFTVVTDCLILQIAFNLEMNPMIYK